MSGAEAEQLYRVAQEALNNALRHGGARRVEVHLSALPDARVLHVSDGGRGFPPGMLSAQHRAGMGLRIMRHRAQLIGGLLGLSNVGLSGEMATARTLEVDASADDLGAGNPSTDASAGATVTCTLLGGVPLAKGVAEGVGSSLPSPPDATPSALSRTPPSKSARGILTHDLR